VIVAEGTDVVVVVVVEVVVVEVVVEVVVGGEEMGICSGHGRISWRARLQGRREWDSWWISSVLVRMWERRMLRRAYSSA
jgi:hypothetical protein